MAKNKKLKPIDRDATLVQAITKDGHRGYQKWHREYDIMVVDYLNNHDGLNLVGFQKYINKIYSKGDLHKIFGDVIIKFISKK